MSNGLDIKNVTLVHGGFVDGSGWQAVYDLLTADGYSVRVVQNPTLSLEGDVAATRQILDGQDAPVVLVGHSYGGAVITEAGNHPNVAALVYLAAFAPDRGESVNTLIADPPAGRGFHPSCRRRTDSSFWTVRSFRRRSPATYRPTKRRSWPTRKSRGASTPSVA